MEQIRVEQMNMARLSAESKNDFADLAIKKIQDDKNLKRAWKEAFKGAEIDK